MIKFVDGDFFDYDADIRVNTVNCVGVMGAGVALEFKNKYPDMFKAYVEACNNQDIRPGKPFLWEEIGLFSNTLIINLPTKIHWRNPSEYSFIEEDLKWLRCFLLEHPDSTITLPALGCGHGGLDWNIVKDMIVHYLDGIKATILVFNPTSSNSNSFITNKNSKAGTHVVYPFDEDYPQELLKKYNKELFYKGNSKLLKDRKISIIVGNEVREKEKNALLRIIDEINDEQVTYVVPLNSGKHEDYVRSLLENGVKLIIVIPYGIKCLKKEYLYRDYYDNILFLTHKAPMD
ncbi:macro domain-containing protein, partial [Pseudobutyrivibrio sp.]|uniref:macro domain-containing protein n=1 Tax=Pseudobutyrivibrio sp. TaxID=2014367 RepID=UPI0038675891